MAFLCFQRDCFALDPWGNSPEVRVQAQAEGWESCAIAFVLGSAHMGRRCCGDVEVVVVRPQKTKKKKKTVRKGLLDRAERPSLFTQRANQNVTSPRSLAPLSALQPSRFIFARLSRPRPSLLSCSLHTPSINSLDLHSRPFSAATDACCSFCCGFHAGEDAMRWLEVVKGRPVMCYIHFPVDCGHRSCTEK